MSVFYSIIHLFSLISTKNCIVNVTNPLNYHILILNLLAVISGRFNEQIAGVNTYRGMSV